MTHPSQPGYVPGPLSLTLVKLSFCTTPALRSSLVWTHIPQRDNLFAVFDHVTVRNVEGFTQKKVLKLVRGGDVLEQIELDNLVQQAGIDEQRARSQLLEDADRYVILLMKRPLLAMRYQLPNGQIRRIQLNFSPESGYDAAVNALKGLDLPIRDKNQHSMNPAVTAARVSQYSQYNMPAPQPTHALPDLEYNYQPYTSNGYGYKPSSSAPEPATERPWSAPDPVSFSQMLPPKRELPLAMRTYVQPSEVPTRAPVNPQYSSKSATIPSPQPLAQPSTRKKREVKTAKPRAPKKAPPIVPEVHEEIYNEVPTSGQPPKLSKPQRKPAPASYAKSRTLTKASENSVLLSGPNSSGDSSEAGSIAPPARTIGPIELAIRQGLPNAVKSTESRSRQTNLPSTIKNVPTSPEDPAGHLASRISRQAMTEVTGNTTARQPDPPDPSNAAAQATANATATTAGQEEVSVEEYLSCLNRFVRDFQHLPAPAPPQTTADELAAYAAQPDEVRQAIIKKQILDCLNDENFIKLAEDVENEWRRIGLGF